MASEFEEYRRKKIIENFIDLAYMEVKPNEIVCPECLSPVFKLDSEKGILCY